AGAYIRERGDNGVFEFLRGGWRKPRQMNLDQRITARSARRRRDRMKHRERMDALLTDLSHDGIDQEWHVGAARFEKVAVEIPAFSALPVTQADLLLFRFALSAPSPERMRERD